MSDQRLKDLLERVLTWPKECQDRVLKFVVDIEAEMARGAYRASRDELRSIDAALTDETASQEEVKDSYDKLRGL